MVGPGRAGVEGDEDRRQLARRDPRLGPDDGERVGVALLRHQGARAAVAVGQGHGGELLAGEDLQVLPELRAVRGRGGHRRGQLDVGVGLPHRVLRVRHHARAPQQVGQAGAVERPARAGAAAGPGDAQVQAAVDGAQALGVAQRRGGVGQQQVADGRRLRRLQVGVVGREVAGVALGQPGQGLRAVQRRVVQVEGPRAGAQAQGDPEGLAAGPAGAEPPRRRGPHALGQGGLARVERVAQLRPPGELRGGDGVEVEQAAEQRPGVAGRDGAGLGQGDGVGDVGQRQPGRQAGGGVDLVGVARPDQLRCRAALQAPARAEVAVAHRAPRRARPAVRRSLEGGLMRGTPRSSLTLPDLVTMLPRLILRISTVDIPVLSWPSRRFHERHRAPPAATRRARLTRLAPVRPRSVE